MIYALCRKIDFVENLRVLGVKIWTEISIRVKNLTFSMSGCRVLEQKNRPMHPPVNKTVTVTETICRRDRRKGKSLAAKKAFSLLAKSHDIYL